MESLISEKKNRKKKTEVTLVRIRLVKIALSLSLPRPHRPPLLVLLGPERRVPGSPMGGTTGLSLEQGLGLTDVSRGRPGRRPGDERSHAPDYHFIGFNHWSITRM